LSAAGAAIDFTNKVVYKRYHTLVSFYKTQLYFKGENCVAYELDTNVLWIRNWRRTRSAG